MRLTIEEWQRAVIEAMRPKIEAMQDELDGGTIPIHGARAQRVHEYLSEARTAACEGDANEVERLLDLARKVFDQELEFYREQ
jgi:hypothetical protein